MNSKMMLNRINNIFLVIFFSSYCCRSLHSPYFILLKLFYFFFLWLHQMDNKNIIMNTSTNNNGTVSSALGKRESKNDVFGARLMSNLMGNRIKINGLTAVDR